MIETVTGVEIYEDDIDAAMQEFCDRYNIDEPEKMKQSRWNSCLEYVRSKLFSPPLGMKIGNHFNHNSTLDYTDVKSITELANRYVFLCELYDKEVSQMGFSKLTGISVDTIKAWETKDAMKPVYEKIVMNRNESIYNRLFDSKSPVGVIAYANNTVEGFVGDKTEHVHKESGKLIPRSELVELKEIPLPDTSGADE